MFDLCSIYGQENSALLGKMISNIFTNQPRYSQDLMATVDSTYEVWVGCCCNTEEHDLLMCTLENVNTCIIHILSYGPKVVC